MDRRNTWGRPILAVAILGMGWLTSPSVAWADDRGMLRIVTVPGDAQIFVDGKRKGNSPSEPGQSFAIKLAEGSYVVEAVKADGVEYRYAGRKDEVFVSDGTMQTVTLKLERQQTPEGRRLAAERDAEAKRLAAERAAERERERVGLIKRALGEIEAGMVVVPAGNFRMGRDGLPSWPNERPVHTVSVRSFAMGKTEVTFDQWDACVADGGCSTTLRDNGWGRGTRPVVGVRWHDAQMFLAWLNKRTGKTYRLPSEAEWEYAARAGRTTKWFWGNDLGKGNANCANCGSQWDKKTTAPVGSFRPNPYGFYDMNGNVSEWVEDCWHSDYRGAPSNGSAWLGDGCGERGLRGGDWKKSDTFMNTVKRDRIDIRYAYGEAGFRLARTLP